MSKTPKVYVKAITVTGLNNEYLKIHFRLRKGLSVEVVSVLLDLLTDARRTLREHELSSFHSC